MLVLLADCVQKRHSTEDVITVLIALRHRSALRAALKGKDEESLQPILKFIIRHLNDPRFIKVVTDVAMLVLDMYGAQMGLSSDVDALVRRLHSKVRMSAEASQQALATQGMLETLMAG
jgi:U3 small nucleolar RNA-associated protein 15